MTGDLIYSLLLPLGGGIGWFFKTWFSRTDAREAALSRRESTYQEQIDRKIEEMAARIERIEYANGVLIGVVHVIVDDHEPDSPTLAAISTLLKEAFPVPADTPPFLLNLTARLDAKTRRKRNGAS